MTRSHSNLFGEKAILDEPEVASPDKGAELPLFEALGVPTPDGVAAQLGYIREYLKAAGKQYASLDEYSQRLFAGIYLDMALVIDEVAELAAIRNRQGE
jgi:hypothetical protein